MRFTHTLDADIVSLLRKEGFKRKGNVFIRLHADGILQCIFSARGATTKDCSYSISVRSIYEPDVFGDVSLYRGALTYPFELSDFNIEKIAYHSNYDTMKYACLPKLNNTNSQESFCELISLLDTKRFGFVRWYMDMLSIPSLMALGQYALSVQKCDIVLSHNDKLINVLKMKKVLETGDPELVYSFLMQAQSSNLHQFASLKFK